MEMSEWDRYVVGRDTARTYVELTNLYVHPLRRGRGWANELLSTAKEFAYDNNWNLFLRAVPYGKDPCEVEQLIALYKRHGFKSTRRDPREMLLRWQNTKAK